MDPTTGMVKQFPSRVVTYSNLGGGSSIGVGGVCRVYRSCLITLIDLEESQTNEDSLSLNLSLLFAIFCGIPTK